MPKYLQPMFNALADTTRREVGEALSTGPATVSELAEPFDMSLPAFVQHLGVLEKSGLIRTEKRGRVRTCYLEQEALQTLEDWVVTTREYWESRLDALTAYAEQLHDSDRAGAGYEGKADGCQNERQKTGEKGRETKDERKNEGET